MSDEEILDLVIRLWGTMILAIGIVLGWQLHSIFGITP